MTNRTVTVGLKAEVGQYKRGVGEAERATERLADAIDDVDGKSFDDAAARAKKLGGAVGDAGDEANKAARELAEMAWHAKKLDEQIRNTESDIRALAKGFASTGDVKILAAIREQQKSLMELRNVRRILPDPGQAAQVGEQLATRIGAGFETRARTSLPNSIRNALNSASPAKLGAAGLGAALAPTVGALVAAAVVGGAGIGGIVGGVALAAKSPVIADRVKDLGKMVSGGLQLEASQALTHPMLGALDELEALAQRSLPKIGAIFEAIAPSIERLTQSLGRGADSFLDGLVHAAQQAQPVLDEIGNLIADTGQSLGTLFADVSEHSEAAASGIHDVNEALQQVITVVGGVAEVLLIIKEFEDSLDRWAEKGSFLGTVFVALKDYLYGPLKPIVELIKGARELTGAGDSAQHSFRRVAGAMGEMKSVAEELVATEEDVKEAQDQAKQAQDAYSRSIEALNPAGVRASKVVDGLRRATELLYGAQIQATDANEAYEASWDDLSESVKKNKRSLDIHTAAGRSNRDALQDLVTKSKEMYFADINAGVATDQAAKKHRERTKAVEKEAEKLGLNKKVTGELITTYGQIPPKKTTDLVVEGVKEVADKLYELSVIQYALAKGIPVGSARAVLKGEHGPAKSGGYAHGGRFDGQLPGPPSNVDNLTGVGPQGQTFGLAGGEYVVNARSTAKHLPELIAINQDRDGYASGGYFPPMDTSRRWPFEVTADRAKIMSEAEARAKVAAKIAVSGSSFAGSGNWPSSPSAQRGDSGVWHKVVALIKSTGPISGSFGNSYRPGDPKWHGSGRAVDWMGFNQDALATFLASRNPLELIHRTKHRDYAYTRGRNKGSFNNALMEAHRNHIHIAMAGGGVINEHILGIGRSGATYEFGERGPETVTPGYAAGGLVNVAPSSTPTAGGGSHLDYLDAVLSARAAVSALSAALKENGKNWSVATAKGRDNRNSLIAGIRAAQHAAEAKYEETGSIKAANKVYADYIKQLDAAMKKMGVNAKARRDLLKAYSEKPDYSLPTAKTASNSSARVKSVQDFAGAEEALLSARVAFAWTKPSFSGRTQTGRAELQQLFGFLGAAEAAAQSQYQETGNAKMATALYGGYINQLRAILIKSGMSKGQVDSLLKQYGRITLSRNAAGGLYEHAATGLLRDAHIASGNRTLYAYAEPKTGGELFAPKFGNMATTRKNVTKAVTQWWGGRDPWGTSGGRAITVNATIPITLGVETITRQVRLEVDAAVGQVVNATVYQTA
jgi:hypothetical protein